MSFFEAKSITAAYGRVTVIKNFSFSAEAGELVGLLGENGCGKTTLIRALCGIIRHGGECFIAGKRTCGLGAAEMARISSYIPQRSGLDVDIPVIDVVLMGFNPQLRLFERPNKKMIARAKEAIAEVGLSKKEADNYMTLSEGQKQLVLLARTLVSDAPLMLLDEPESALDIRHRYAMLTRIRAWLQSGGERCAIASLHDPNLALSHCDRIVAMTNEGPKTLFPATDPIERLESVLSQIYGKISILHVADSAGRERLVMLKNEEDIE